MILLLLLQASAGVDFDLRRVPAARPSCTSGTDVVVCGSRPDRHRLPLPHDIVPSERSAEASGVSAITPSGRCGIFAGERRCGKREALAYGYGGGRDPVTVVAGVIRAVVDPDE